MAQAVRLASQRAAAAATGSVGVVVVTAQRHTRPALVSRVSIVHRPWIESQLLRAPHPPAL